MGIQRLSKFQRVLEKPLYGIVTLDPYRASSSAGARVYDSSCYLGQLQGHGECLWFLLWQLSLPRALSLDFVIRGQVAKILQVKDVIFLHLKSLDP